MNLPISALSDSDIQLLMPDIKKQPKLPHQPFDIAEFEYHFPTIIAAKLAIADDLATPLAKLSSPQTRGAPGTWTARVSQERQANRGLVR
ncbi:hypothetical protein KKJ29_03865 [Xenorhabdus bovienii]|nr:hypothetical protein [Xenorhabdus bovienii]MDE9426982.1 hypothetical protein [Xenorhabdus bovienii]